MREPHCPFAQINGNPKNLFLIRTVMMFVLHKICAVTLLWPYSGSKLVLPWAVFKVNSTAGPLDIVLKVGYIRSARLQFLFAPSLK